MREWLVSPQFHLARRPISGQAVAMMSTNSVLHLPIFGSKLVNLKSTILVSMNYPLGRHAR